MTKNLFDEIKRWADDRFQPKSDSEDQDAATQTTPATPPAPAVPATPAIGNWPPGPGNWVQFDLEGLDHLIASRPAPVPVKEMPAHVLDGYATSESDIRTQMLVDMNRVVAEDRRYFGGTAAQRDAIVQKDREEITRMNTPSERKSVAPFTYPSPAFLPSGLPSASKASNTIPIDGSVYFDFGDVSGDNAYFTVTNGAHPLYIHVSAIPLMIANLQAIYTHLKKSQDPNAAQHNRNMDRIAYAERVLHAGLKTGHMVSKEQSNGEVDIHGKI
jgi:hypothetical protein